MSDKFEDEGSVPIKVLTIASGDLWAGAEAVVYQLSAGLKTKPFIQHTVVLMNHGRLETLCMQEGIDTRVIDENRYGFAMILAKLIAICRSGSPDIIHAHRYKENLLAALVAASCGRPRLVTTVHGLPEGMDSTPKGIIKSAVNRFLVRRVFDATVAVSNDIARKLADRSGVPAKRLSTIVNGIDVRNCIPKKTRTPKDVFTVGSAGRLFPVKDYPLMVDIARLTCVARPNVRFVLAGDGPEKDAILHKVRTHRLDDRFILMGHVEDMQAFYAGLDIYINTSIHEGFPMAVLEAMARGIPVVAFDVGGLSEIISHGQGGYLVKNRDARDFSLRIIELIDDHDRLETFGENARITVSNRFTTTHMTESYCRLYALLMKENRP